MAYSAPQLTRSQICRYESRLDGTKPSAKSPNGRKAHRRASAVSTAQATGTVPEERLTSNSSASTSCVTDRLNQLVREGDYEVSLVEKQVIALLSREVAATVHVCCPKQKSNPGRPTRRIRSRPVLQTHWRRFGPAAGRQAPALWAVGPQALRLRQSWRSRRSLLPS